KTEDRKEPSLARWAYCLPLSSVLCKRSRTSHERYRQYVFPLPPGSYLPGPGGARRDGTVPRGFMAAPGRRGRTDARADRRCRLREGGGELLRRVRRDV